MILVMIIPCPAEHGIIEKVSNFQAAGNYHGEVTFMQVLIISDIHANYAALTAVLEATAGKWEQIWFLGDLVGYGPDPNECVEELRKHDHIALSGNHDQAVLGYLDVQSFNREASKAINWTREELSEDALAYLESLPSKHVEHPFTLAHASPRYPVWEYILDPHTAADNFRFMETPYCFVGHTHVPVIFTEKTGLFNRVAVQLPNYDADEREISLADERLIINPGSVGQPRDADSRAAYALLDTDTLRYSYHRTRMISNGPRRKCAKLGCRSGWSNDWLWVSKISIISIFPHGGNQSNRTSLDHREKNQSALGWRRASTI
jgi:diadenosine tetraphosphatase ApaH/serine/threonine PP2A family protein phosphatase